jgi:phage shock protein PspC (stress-responsive transcriptional regulator)
MDQPQQRLLRSRNNRVLAGVCGGLADYFRIDATLLRIIFIVLTLWKGWVALIYLALWLVIPETDAPQSGDDRVKQVTADMKATAQRVAETVKNSEQSRTFSRYMLGALLIIVGVVALVQRYIPWDQIQWNYVWPSAVIMVGLWVLFRRPSAT